MAGSGVEREDVSVARSLGTQRFAVRDVAGGHAAFTCQRVVPNLTRARRSSLGAAAGMRQWQLMAITMKDIARDLGVSVVTVSKVLRNHSDISAETRKRVWQRIKELNYRPNPAARTLVTGRTNLIGLIVPDLVHPFFSEVAKGITSRLRSQEYSLIIASSEDDAALERSEIDQMLARRVDALILASTQT